MSESKSNKIVIDANCDSDITTVEHTYTYSTGRKVKLTISSSVIVVEETDYEGNTSKRMIYASDLMNMINSYGQ